jgi:glycosyltransferase involved in cell wall biosynthesis
MANNQQDGRELAQVNQLPVQELVNILYLKHLTDAISFRPYLERLGAASVLQWWLDRVRIPVGSSLYIVCHSKAERDAILDLLGSDSRYTVYCSAKATLFAALGEITAAAHCARVSVLALSLCLCPADVLERMYAHHCQYNNKITLAEGLPVGSAPVIFDADVVQACSEVYSDDIMGSLKLAFKKAQALATSSPAQGYSGVVPFNASAAYCLVRARLPRTMVLDSPKDIAILLRVYSRGRLSPELDLMQIWREELISDASRYRECIRGLLPLDRSPVPAQRKKRILFIAPRSGFAGAEQVLCDLLDHLDPQQFEAFVLTPGAEGLLTDRLRKAGAHLLCSVNTLYENTLSNFGQVFSVLGEIRPDLIHQNGPGGLPLVCAATLMGIPLVLHVHFAPDGPFEEPASCADAVIAVSQFVKSRLLALNLASEKVHVIHNGIDGGYYRPEAFSKEEARQHFCIPAQAKVALCVARIDPQKRHDLLLSACARVKSTCPSFHLVLNGEASENAAQFDKLQKQLADSGLHSCVTWVPFEQEMRKLYVTSDIVVLCGEYEGLPRSLAEAMAMGIPAIGADSGAIPELITTGETGLLVKPGDVDALAETMLSLLTNEGLRNRLTAAARSRIESHFSILTQSRAIMELYHELIDFNRSRTPHLTAAVI